MWLCFADLVRSTTSSPSSSSSSSSSYGCFFRVVLRNIGLGKFRVSFSLFFCWCSLLFLCNFLRRLWKLKQQIVRYNSQKSLSLLCRNLIIISFASSCTLFPLSPHFFAFSSIYLGFFCVSERYTKLFLLIRILLQMFA